MVQLKAERINKVKYLDDTSDFVSDLMIQILRKLFWNSWK